MPRKGPFPRKKKDGTVKISPCFGEPTGVDTFDSLCSANRYVLNQRKARALAAHHVVAKWLDYGLHPL